MKSSWPLYHIEGLAAHVAICKGSRCHGRFPDVSECDAAELANQYLRLIKEVKAAIDNDDLDPMFTSTERIKALMREME